MKVRIHDALAPLPQCVSCKTVHLSPRSWRSRLSWLLLASATAINFSYLAYSLDANSWFMQGSWNQAVSYWVFLICFSGIALGAVIMSVILLYSFGTTAAVYCSLDEEGKLHTHPPHQEPMLTNREHTACQINNADATVNRIVHRKADAPILLIHLRGFRAPRAVLYASGETKWRVSLDLKRRLCLHETGSPDLSFQLPIFKEPSNTCVLKEHNIELALRLLAEESNSLIGFIERGMKAWQDELPACARKPFHRGLPQA